MAILQFKNVFKGFGEGADRSEVLSNINLEVEEGEFLAILGFSGSGKTTLISLMAGLEFPDEGGVFFNGETEEE